MSDKACYQSHVRVLENSAARVVVQWRYKLETPYHYWAHYDAKTGWGDIADWYFYIYPDGVASVRQRLYSRYAEGAHYSDGRDVWFEWDEQIAVLGEGQHPDSVLSKSPVMTLVDRAGKATSYDWNPKPPTPKFEGNIIQMIHFTGRYSPFAIQEFNSGDVYRTGDPTWYTTFPCWNHWPTAQVDSSARLTSFPDRAAHSSISHLYWPLYAQQRGNVPFQEKVLLQGMTDQPAASLTDLARSWLNAPWLEAISDCYSTSYDQAQRAYLVCATGPAPSFKVSASPEHPLVNPCFVVKDWHCGDPAQLEIDSKAEAGGPTFRQGIVRDSFGKPSLVVWLKRQLTTPATFTLRRAVPEGSGGN